MRSVLILTVVLVPGGRRAECLQTPAACQRLASLSLANTAITLAQVTSAGAFTVPANPAGRGGGSLRVGGHTRCCSGRAREGEGDTAGLGLGYNGGRGIPPFSTLPAFCRVAATLKPSPSSDIHMEMWIPIAGWNGQFRGTSPNGLGGVINYNAMSVALTDGFAVARPHRASGRRHRLDAGSGQGDRLRRPRHARDDGRRQRRRGRLRGVAPTDW